MSSGNIGASARTTAVSLIPRYVANLNALAERHGLTATVVVEPYDNDPEVRLWGKWRGTRANFLSLVQPVASYHLPLSRGRLNIPGGAWFAVNPLLTGDVTVAGDQVEYAIDFGPGEYAITECGDVEVVTSADETAYHGAADALLALGIPQSRLPVGKRNGKKDNFGLVLQGSTWLVVERWSSRRQPDGSIVYRAETPAARRRRAAASSSVNPSHLRLVVDDTVLH
jgi:hypothetical protein